MSAPLVPLIRCTQDPPCGRCWYCCVHDGGLEWWLGKVPIVRLSVEKLLEMYALRKRRRRR